MKHYSVEQWADFVREAGPSQESAAMRAHLRSGCGECLRTASLWQRIQEVAAREAAFAPPESAVRVARSLQVGRRPRPVVTLGTVLAELIWDSRREFAPAGIRTLSASPQQMLYKAGDFAIDVRLERLAGADRYALAGQILNSVAPTGHLVQVPVTLEMDGWPVGMTHTNLLGEFRLEFAGCGKARVRVDLGGRAEVLIPMGRIGSGKSQEAE